VTNRAAKIKAGTPGFLLCLLLGAGAIYLGKIIGAPVMLLAIIIGLILHILFSLNTLKSGINWSSRGLLYTGVAQRIFDTHERRCRHLRDLCRSRNLRSP